MTPIAEEIWLYASHCQFYIQDYISVASMGDASFWTDEAHEMRLARAAGLLGVGTGSYDHVKVRVEQHFGIPPLDLAEWDHVVEAGLDVRSGLLLIYGCISPTGLFDLVAPGHYCVRCCHANLAGATDSTGDAKDWYLIQFWSAEKSEVRVLKQWQP